ncbi:VOC family protein [Micromonospora sp. NPDC047670]|uniref:VOC family protein n=1 Tax=Micromonospora sp. NPDC047670 TaxID=3364252 RepID=UPI00371571B8
MPLSRTLDPHVRIARPSRDLAAAERFWVGGLGLDVLWRSTADGSGEHDLLMVGLPGAGWHLELVGGERLAADPAPTADDLLVLYLDGPVADELVQELERAGGTRVSAGPYWDRWGVTVADPDGYRLVLSTRGWSND